MAGQIIRRGPSTWLVRIPQGRNGSGTRLYHNRTIQGSKKDAERYRTKTLRELDTNTFVEASQASVGSFLIDWLEQTVKGRVKARTLDDYRSLADRYLIPAFGHRRLSQLSPSDIQKAYFAMRERGLSPGYVPRLVEIQAMPL